MPQRTQIVCQNCLGSVVREIQAKNEEITDITKIGTNNLVILDCYNRDGADAFYTMFSHSKILYYITHTWIE